MSIQVLPDAGIAHEITCPQAFASVKKVQGLPAGFCGNRTSQRIEIHGCQPGCFP